MKKMFNHQNKLEINITEKDMMSFILISAAKGLTPEKLLECFVKDIVSYFSSEAVTIEEDFLARWFFGSWFSQDDDGYFSFLQYLICNRRYRFVVTALNDIRKCNLKMSKHRLIEHDRQHIENLRKFLKGLIKEMFKEYCAINPAHKSLSEEIKIIRNFEKKHKLCVRADPNCFDDIMDCFNSPKA